MKKAIFVAAISFVALGSVQAQEIESAKKLMVLGRFKDARTDIDKAVLNPKYNAKPETWLVRSTIYNGLASSGVPAADSLNFRKEALGALQKYTELEPSRTLVNNATWSDVPRQLYVAFFNSGINKFNKKDWAEAHADLKTAATLSEYLLQSKILTGSIDTNLVLYTGASAQNANNKEEALTWYKKLIDNKVAGKDNEFIYQYVTDYYLNQQDEANFKKYEQIGLQLYPDSKYFSNISLDYARKSNDFGKVIRFYEDKAAASPNDYDLQYNLGAEIFDYLYPRDTAKIPTGNVSGMEQSMINAFQKASAIKPDKGLPLAIIGTHYAKRVDDINRRIDSISTVMRNVNKGIKPDKTGKLPPVPKDLIAKREALYQEMNTEVDKTTEWFTKATAVFKNQATMEPIEKQFYKNAVSSLIDIYQMKKNNAKGKPADIARFAAEQKKWESAYDSIK